jgi:uncharacterized protein (DUF1800 family)
MKGRYSFVQKATAFVMGTALIIPAFSINLSGQTMNTQSKNTQTKAAALTEDQKALHVLNRLGFGARAGDIEKVKAMGVRNYIEQQLNASSINDSATEAKLQNFDALKMSNDELFAKYPNGAAVQKAVAAQNGMSRKDVQGAIKDAREARQNAQMTNGNATTAAQPNESNPADAQKYRQEINQLYRENNLGRPQQITQQLAASRIIRAVYSERQLQEQMVDFWSNHFNVYTNKAAVRWFLPEYDRDVIRPNALGNFRDLLTATAKSPAMLFFLDNFQSAAPNNEQTANNQANIQKRLERLQNNPRARENFMRNQNITSEAELNERLQKMQQRATQGAKRQQRGINENYAREIMELHTLGVGGGYSQQDIQEIARAFTGWTIVNPRGYAQPTALMGNEMPNRPNMQRVRQAAGVPADARSGAFYFNERIHDKGSKTILGQTVNEGGMKDGLKVIDILVKHPSTAKFIARKLAVKFVNDNPSEAYVNRIAAAFTKSDGDIKSTLREMFDDPEFYAPENYKAKIKTPFEVTVSAIRTVGAETNGMAVQQLLAKMGEPLYGWQAPTGYPDTAEDWVNTGALLERMNFAVALASNRIPGTKVNLSKFSGNSTDKNQLLDKFTGVILSGELSPATRATLIKQLDQPLMEPTMPANDEAAMENVSMMRPNAGQGGGRRGMGQQAQLLQPSGNPEVFKVVGLILGSPEFQRQ